MSLRIAELEADADMWIDRYDKMCVRAQSAEAKLARVKALWESCESLTDEDGYNTDKGDEMGAILADTRKPLAVDDAIWCPACEAIHDGMADDCYLHQVWGEPGVTTVPVTVIVLPRESEAQ
jgi:hypothetical protein